MIDSIVMAILLVACLGAIGYFVKKKFDKVDKICTNLAKLERAIYLIPCVKHYLNGGK